MRHVADHENSLLDGARSWGRIWKINLTSLLSRIGKLAFHMTHYL
jgi:hypothetical protein